MQEEKNKGGRPSLEPGKRRGEQMNIRFTAVELERLDRYCKAKGWTRSQTIRYWLDMITT